MSQRNTSEKEGLEHPEALSSSSDHGKTSFERLRVRIDHADDLSAAEQIARKIASFVADGALRPEERLPPVETAARHIGVRYKTMGAAYQLLARFGISTNTTGIGTYFTANADRAARRYLLSFGARALVREARTLELDQEEIVGVVLTVLSASEPDDDRHADALQT